MPKLITAMLTGSKAGSLNMTRVSKNHHGPRHSRSPIVGAFYAIMARLWMRGPESTTSVGFAG